MKDYFRLSIEALVNDRRLILKDIKKLLCINCEDSVFDFLE